MLQLITIMKFRITVVFLISTISNLALRHAGASYLWENLIFINAAF